VRVGGHGGRRRGRRVVTLTGGPVDPVIAEVMSRRKPTTAADSSAVSDSAALIIRVCMLAIVARTSLFESPVAVSRTPRLSVGCEWRSMCPLRTRRLMSTEVEAEVMPRWSASSLALTVSLRRWARRRKRTAARSVSPIFMEVRVRRRISDSAAR